MCTWKNYFEINFNRLKTLTLLNQVQARDHWLGERNWCERSCAGAIRPMPDLSGRHSEYMPPLRLPLRNPPCYRKSHPLVSFRPSCARNGCRQSHGWGGLPTGKYDRRVGLQGAKKQINTNRLGPKNAPPNSFWLVEGKHKGGWATGRAVEIRDPGKRLWIKKKRGMREGTHALAMKKSNRTHQPFYGDGLRDPVFWQWDGPTAVSWQNLVTLRGCTVGTGRSHSLSAGEDATTCSKGQIGPRGARSTVPALEESSPYWTANLNRAEWADTRRATGFTDSFGELDWWRDITWDDMKKRILWGYPPWVHFFRPWFKGKQWNSFPPVCLRNVTEMNWPRRPGKMPHRDKARLLACLGVGLWGCSC